MSSSHNAAPQRHERHAVLETLHAQYAVFRDYLPLAVGIHKVIKERMPELEVAQLRQAMRIHTTSTRYLKAQAADKERFDLDGKPDGVVSKEQADLAGATLRERFKKAADRKRAEEHVRAAQQKEQERLEKLKQLADRFNRR